MNEISTRRRFRIFAVIAAAAAGLAITSCSNQSSDGDSGHAGTDDHAVIDPLDPTALDAVATATTAMQTILSWQPAVDTSKSDALVRARPWLGGGLLATVEGDNTAQSGVRPDSEWLAWKESGDALTASCSKAESTPAAPSGMRTVVIDVSCRQTVLHAQGSSTNRSAETWRTTVTRTDDGWRLTDFRYQ